MQLNIFSEFYEIFCNGFCFICFCCIFIWIFMDGTEKCKLPTSPLLLANSTGQMARKQFGKFRVLQTLKQNQGSKPPRLLELRDAETTRSRTHSVASYDHTRINGECNCDAAILKCNPLVTTGVKTHEHMNWVTKSS
jgi:hypothetical protein